MKQRMSAKDRKEQLMNIALKLSSVHGYNKITRQMIADEAGITVANITHFFGTMNNVRRDIIRHAIKNKELSVVAQGLAHDDPHAKKASQQLKEAAAKHLVNP